ncbi:TrbI/VirB10 family protein [Sphingomonas sp.]|uniref:TrbI/VirB10 family protein n=1 Tax=Sphingomonas sp. TaxID=28214 RepID=UPI003F720742
MSGSEPMEAAPAMRDVRPNVGTATRQLPTWVFIAGVIAAGLILFVVLETRRSALSAPAVTARTAGPTAFAAPPPLPIPAVPAPQPSPPLPPAVATVISAPTPPPAPAPRPAPAPEPQIVYVPQPQSQSASRPEPVRSDTAAVLVIDQGAPARTERADAGRGDDQEAAKGQTQPRDTSRARSSVLANRSTTIVQGTLIQAVLESGLDSTRAGFARAIVSRDVRGFDNSRVLIPRGSRLIGEYDAQTSAGQKRALINWTRLVRPDGVTIAIGSPSADTVGRTGVRARVNSHFFERFSGAILQSALDIGVNIASREAGAPTIYALPGANVTAQAVQPQQITPTLTVKPGTSVSVFVARDLDFTGAAAVR